MFDETNVGLNGFQYRLEDVEPEFSREGSGMGEVEGRFGGTEADNPRVYERESNLEKRVNKAKGPRRERGYSGEGPKVPSSDESRTLDDGL